MAARDTQAGRPSWSLAPQALSIAYGQAQFMSSTGAASPSGWFGPLAPLEPIAPPEVAGRGMDFPSGYNIVSGARAYEPIGFEDLRALAETYDLLRLVIETRKDQVERMSWGLRPRRGAAGPGLARINQLTRFFERPDGQHCFAIWLRMLLEDLFVIDAPTLWRQRARDGSLVALHPLDGATIKRVIDDWGRTPQPFIDNGALIHPVAYQQILKGYPAVDYAARDIIYAPRNPRANRVYGFSPVEQIVMTANIALKRQMFTLSHFTEGNIPESLIGVPDSWTPDQIKNFQDYWDAYFTGDLAARRRAKFVPGGVAKTFIQTKEPELKGAFDEWLARVVCYAFSVSHQAFVNQTNRSTGETQKEMAEEEGLWPVLKWVKRLIDGVLIEDFGEEEVEFAWGEDAQIDAGKQAQVLTSYVAAGILTRNEARVKLGEAPVADEAANVLTVTGPAPTPVGQGSAELAKNYNPDQPRDWHGRFGEGDGNGSSHNAQTALNVDPNIASDVGPDVTLTQGAGYPVDLTEHEQHGGHTIKMHVAKSEDFLISRSETTRLNLGFADVWKAMGSFASLQSAGKLVNSTIAENQEIVDQVAAPKDQGGLPGAEITKDFVRPTGYESYPPSGGAKFRIRPTYSVKVIIRHDHNMKSGYRVVTSFPFNPR
jgi:hypothetical protein